jgi:hypothetical protein
LRERVGRSCIHFVSILELPPPPKKKKQSDRIKEKTKMPQVRKLVFLQNGNLNVGL